jgi:hypothetical protein
MTGQFKNIEVTERLEVLEVAIYYPNAVGNNYKAVQVELCDVRAADGIRISYDFDRDGWKIEQAQVFEWDGKDVFCDPEYKEVAFVKA